MSKFSKEILSTLLILIVSNFVVQLDNTSIMMNSVQAAISEEGGGYSCSHTYGWSTSKAATCTTAGENVYKCTKCGYIKSRYTVVPTGHPGYSPLTCTQDSVCIRCGYIGQKATGHNYTNATCTAAKKCTKCGATTGTSLGHNYITTYESGSVDKHAKMLECRRCSYSTETIENHTFDVTDKCTKCGYQKVCAHSYSIATCTTPKKCVRCGITSGAALGHNYAAATCQTPKTCTRCRSTVGTSLEHNYIGATCTSGGKCLKCGEINEKGLGHAFTKATCKEPSKCVRCGEISGKALGHNYTKATCKEPAKCTRCNETKGKALNHLYTTATCELPAKCTRCGEESAKALGHTFANATCTEPQKCTKCGETKGKKLEHDYEGGTCKTAGKCVHCGKAEEKLSEHNYTKSTCTDPAKCTVCGLIKEKALGHDFKPATCTNPKSCKRCGITEGKANGHEVIEATCNTPKKCKNCRLVLNKALGHTYAEATCKTPKTCVKCGATSGKTLKHDYIKATCISPKICKSCGDTVGEPLEHDLKLEKKDEKEHTISCKNCTYKKIEAHAQGKKCECGFVPAVIEKCTNKKIVQSHNIEKRYGKAYKTVHEVTLHCNDCNINVKQPNEAHEFDNSGKCLCGKEICTVSKIVETHKNIRKTTTKLNSSDAEYAIKHQISTTCQECNVTVKEKLAHTFDEKGKCNCGYTDASKARCTANAMVKAHDIEKQNLVKKDYNYHNFEEYCKACNVTSKQKQEKHTFDTEGACECGYVNINKASCTVEKFIVGHKTTEKYDKTKTTIDSHTKTITCTKCKISKTEVGAHDFNNKGICACQYKDMSKAKCTVAGMVKEHFPERVDLRDEKTTYTPIHTYKLYCKICDVKSEAMTERHTTNSEGVCICGFVDFSKVEKGYTVQRKNKVSYAERIDPDSKVILLGFGGDGEDEWELKQGGQNFVVNDPRVTDACNYAYVTKPEDGWRTNKERVVDTSVNYILKATGCSSLEEVEAQGYKVVLYAFSSGGELLDPVWDELHANGLTPTAEMMVESYVRDRVKDEQITQHADAGTNVHIYSVTNGTKDSISDRTNKAGERLSGTGTNGTIDHTQYIPDEGSKNSYYTHGQAGRQSADSVAEVIENLENEGTEQ